MNLGKLIVIEGIDGSGKSTQATLVYEKLSEKYNTYKTAQPTKSHIGSLLRRYLSGELKADNLVLTTLFASDRLDHVLSKGGLLERYNNGEIIVCDRNYFSSYAYQATNDDFVFEVNEKAREILKPDIHIYIDVEIDVALNRINETRESTEIFETKENLTAIKNEYEKAFLKLRDEENIVFVNGNQSQNKVFSDIMQKVYEIL